MVDIFDDNFVLFHGERIENERETYWIENKHTNSIENADAVLICNSNGYFGDTTIYEIGYAMALFAKTTTNNYRSKLLLNYSLQDRFPNYCVL